MKNDDRRIIRNMKNRGQGKLRREREPVPGDEIRVSSQSCP